MKAISREEYYKRFERKYNEIPRNERENFKNDLKDMQMQKRKDAYQIYCEYVDKYNNFERNTK